MRLFKLKVKFKLYLIFCTSLVALSDIALGSEESSIVNPTQYFGKIPIIHSFEIQEKGDKIWQFIIRRLNISSLTPAPSIQFDIFDREHQEPEWTLWQKEWIRENLTIWQDWFRSRSYKGEKVEVTQDWVEKNIDKVFPFPKTFLAFWYEGTPYIQINPQRTFLAGVQHNHQGIKQDFTGQGYYTLAHEMLHYALDAHGVRDSFIHHCLFITKNPKNGLSFMDELVEFMVQTEIAKNRNIFNKLVNIEIQMSPCERLKSEQMEQVAQFFTESQ